MHDSQVLIVRGRPGALSAWWSYCLTSVGKWRPFEIRYGPADPNGYPEASATGTSVDTAFALQRIELAFANYFYTGGSADNPQSLDVVVAKCDLRKNCPSHFPQLPTAFYYGAPQIYANIYSNVGTAPPPSGPWLVVRKLFMTRDGKLVWLQQQWANQTADQQAAQSGTTFFLEGTHAVQVATFGCGFGPAQDPSYLRAEKVFDDGDPISNLRVSGATAYWDDAGQPRSVTLTGRQSVGHSSAYCDFSS